MSLLILWFVLCFLILDVVNQDACLGSYAGETTVLGSYLGETVVLVCYVVLQLNDRLIFATPSLMVH